MRREYENRIIKIKEAWNKVLHVFALIDKYFMITMKYIGNFLKLLFILAGSWLVVNIFAGIFGAKATGTVMLSTAFLVMIVGVPLFHYFYIKKRNEWGTMLACSIISPVFFLIIICAPIKFFVGTWNTPKTCIVTGCNREQSKNDYYCFDHKREVERRSKEHQAELEASREKASKEKKKKASSGSSYKYSSSSSYTYDFDPDDYDSASDFADDAYGDFND